MTNCVEKPRNNTTWNAVCVCREMHGALRYVWLHSCDACRCAIWRCALVKFIIRSCDLLVYRRRPLTGMSLTDRVREHTARKKYRRTKTTPQACPVCVCTYAHTGNIAALSRKSADKYDNTLSNQILHSSFSIEQMSDQRSRGYVSSYHAISTVQHHSKYNTNLDLFIQTLLDTNSKYKIKYCLIVYNSHKKLSKFYVRKLNC